MRLIDADELLEQYTSEDMAIGGIDIIKTAPTVEAIPIEWLKQFVYTIPDIIEHLIVLWRREQSNEGQGGC